MLAKNTICIWYDKDAEDAARFYEKTFPDSKVGRIARAPGDYPSGQEGRCWWWSSPCAAWPAWG